VCSSDLGAQGTAGTGGAQGTAGAQGTGGTAGGTGSGGAQGAAGTSGGRGGTGGSSAGTGGRGGAVGTGGSAGGGSSGNCAALPFCDTFEAGTVGQPPSSANWTIVNANGGSGTATIDSVGAHGSSKSVKIVGAGQRYWIRNSAVIGTLGTVVHVRFYIRFMSAIPSNHGTLFDTHATVFTMQQQYDDSPAFRLGTQDGAFHWNTDADSNIPDVSPQGKAASFAPTPLTWYCIELTINKSNGNLDFSVDGTSIPGLANDGVPTANIDSSWISSNSAAKYSSIAEFDIGWRDFGSGPMTLWFDDVALSSSTIGCN